MANDLNPTTVFELLHHVAANSNAADLFNLTTGDRLTISNDGQGFHHRTGILWRLFWGESI